MTFYLRDYGHVDHGYAATVHKAQGVTVDRAHVLASGMHGPARGVCGADAGTGRVCRCTGGGGARGPGGLARG